MVLTPICLGAWWRPAQLSREAVSGLKQEHGPSSGDLEKLVFALRSELVRAKDLLRQHRIVEPVDFEKRSSVAGVNTTDIGALAERVVDLWHNERELLWAGNSELKTLVSDLKRAGHGAVNHGSALYHWSRGAGAGAMSKEDTLEMLKDATSKHAKAQEKLLRAEQELSDLQDAHWRLEEEKTELEVRLKAQAGTLELKQRQLAEADLQLSATQRSLQEMKSKDAKDGGLQSDFPEGPAGPDIGLAGGGSDSLHGAPIFASFRGSQQAAGNEMQMQMHRRIQQLLRDVERKETTIKSLQHRLETQRDIALAAGGLDATSAAGLGAINMSRTATVSDLERALATQRAEHKERMDIVEEQVAGLLRLSEERRVLLDEQDRRMQSLNDELANRQGIIDDCRRRLASQAQALKEAAITSSKLEERLDDESDAIVEARRARTAAEEAMSIAQREAEAARQEAREARSFEVELRAAADKNLGDTSRELETCRRRAEQAEEQLLLASEHNDALQAQLRAAEERVADLAGDTSKWKDTWHDMEADLADAKQEIRMLKRSQHDKTLGLETTLTKKESALEDALRESDDLARRLRTAEAEVERTTDTLSEALKREEALRKHSEAIGQVFQVRLLEIQGKYTAAHEAEAGLERELAQVREQRDQEIAAAAAMFKNIEQKALSEKQQATALQQALDYSARLEKEKAVLEDRVATLNLQHISQKSRWAFASFRSDHLSRRVVELEGIKASLESQLRGAFDAADRALVGAGGGLRTGDGLEQELAAVKIDLAQERARTIALQQQLQEGAGEWGPRSSQGADGVQEGWARVPSAATPGGSTPAAWGRVPSAATPATGGGYDATGVILLDAPPSSASTGGAAEVEALRARVREMEKVVEEHGQVDAEAGGGLVQQVKDFRARALGAERQLKDAVQEKERAEEEKRTLEHKLVAMGHTLEALKKSLVSASADQASQIMGHGSSATQQALQEALNENETLRMQVLTANGAKVAPEAGALSTRVSELQQQNDDLKHQLTLANQSAKEAQDRLAKVQEELDAARDRFEGEVTMLRHVADERQRRLKERDDAYRLSGVGLNVPPMHTSAASTRGGASPSQHHQSQLTRASEVADVGIEFSKTGPGPYTIQGVRPGGAAAQCGLITVGDMLHGVGDTPVYELGWQRTMELMLGPPGSDITLWISKARKDGEPRQAVKSVKLKRDLHAKAAMLTDHLQSHPLQAFADGGMGSFKSGPSRMGSLRIDGGGAGGSRRGSRTPLQDFDEARKGAMGSRANSVGTASPSRGTPLAGGARGSVTGSLLYGGLIESDSATDLDGDSQHSAVASDEVDLGKDVATYDNSRGVKSIGLNSAEEAGGTVDRDEFFQAFASQNSPSSRSEDDSMMTDASGEVLGLEQFLQLLRMKNVLPSMITQQEAEAEFYDVCQRRGTNEMSFDDFKDCIREILANKDMLTHSGNFRLDPSYHTSKLPDTRDSYSSDEDRLRQQRDAKSRLSVRGAEASARGSEHTARDSEQRAYDDYIAWERRYESVNLLRLNMHLLCMVKMLTRALDLWHRLQQQSLDTSIASTKE